MLAYKLMRRRRDGTLGPLFIHRRLVVPTGVWLDAESHPTKGYAVRPGWHCTLAPEAPHLRQGGDRVWVKVEIDGVELYTRPASQGGAWALARRMKVLEVMEETQEPLGRYPA